MTPLNLPHPFFFPADAGAPAADAPPADGAGTPPADPPAAAPPADGAGTPPADPPAAATNWWEGDRFTDDQRNSLTALGLTVDDPLEALPKLLDMEANAKRRLGANPDSLIAKPGEGQDLSAWLAEHRETFGLPADAAGYEVSRPEAWPKDVPWNEALEGQAKELAAQHGLPPAALNDLVGLYAGEIARLDENAQEKYSQANQTMMDDLQKAWGDQTNAKIAQATQAANAVAAAAGFEPAVMEAFAQAMKPKVGDAAVIRVFSQIADMMGEDSAMMLAGAGGNIGTTPAEARQQLQKMRSPGGDLYEATKSGNKAAIAEANKRVEHLTKIAVGSK